MNYKKREDIFNWLMVKIRKLLYLLLKLDEHRKFRPYVNESKYIPLLSYSVEKKHYRFNCYCFECPVNENGLCRTTFSELPLKTYIIHEFDGDNIYRNYCG